MRRTLDSVIAQTVRPDLWLIVDNGSSDATPDMQRRMTGSRLRQSQIVVTAL
jgi:glycosyltransferase involved in cell wall biosynthesis